MMDAVEDVKPPINTHHPFAQDAETETKMPLFAECKDLPMKTGEVFRSNGGHYSFMCFNCGLIFEDFGEIINHCEGHYRDVKIEAIVQPTEFVFCAGTESEFIESVNTSKPDTISKKAKSKGVVRRRRKRNPEIQTTSIAPMESRSLTGNSTVTTDHPNEESKVMDIPQNCPICDVWCDKLRDHVKNAHKIANRIMQCYLCKQFFRSYVALRSHISSGYHGKITCYHCAMEPPIKHPSEPRRHKCLFCKEWFPNHVEFKIHFKKAHDKDADYFFRKRANCNIFTCYVCEREFPLRYYLAAHMKIHYDKFLRHQCPTCGRRLRTYGQLTQHLKTHEGKIFSCDQCDKQFQYYAKLRLHRASHNTELNFKCDQCPKKFKQRKYLLTHKAVHSNERKYACKFCDATFNFTSGRRAHEKGRHGAL